MRKRFDELTESAKNKFIKRIKVLDDKKSCGLNVTELTPRVQNATTLRHRENRILDDTKLPSTSKENDVQVVIEEPMDETLSNGMLMVDDNLNLEKDINYLNLGVDNYRETIEQEGGDDKDDHNYDDNGDNNGADEEKEEDDSGDNEDDDEEEDDSGDDDDDDDDDEEEEEDDGEGNEEKRDIRNDNLYNNNDLNYEDESYERPVYEGSPRTVAENLSDGLVYRKQQEYFSDLGALSYTWNTDGVPVFKSSQVSVWPFYLRINELQYAMRIRRENIILAGL
ncbi:probable ATP-dependent helicase PF08_0048 [Microplitis demolitor]|uniref:probable ATP-dependent helicase PF08_0048 n=1 Tax=Microplitis demolitor TaxID=69319 RepID=UPI00235B6A4B|nr:probable ATP-dependent helicase PF08_0048 [Microplitis demolitor]